MAKQSGLGDRFFIGGFDISGDVGSLGSISNPITPLEVTGIDKSAQERIVGQQGGTLEFSTFFNDATGQQHPILKTLPTADTQVAYFRGTTQGNAAAVMTAKQINYDITRAADGSLTTAVQAQSNGFGLEWGQMMTDGIRTDTAATSPLTGLDTGASASFGGQAYLQVFSFSGTDIAIKFDDSADNSTFALTSPVLQFATVTAAPYFERASVANTSTLRRYLRVRTTTTGGFTSCSFAVVVVKNAFAGRLF